MAKGNKAAPNYSLEGLGFSGLNSNPVVQKAIQQKQAESANPIFDTNGLGNVGVNYGDYDASEYQPAINAGAGLTGSDEDIEHQLGDYQSVGQQTKRALEKFVPMTAIQLAQSVTNMAAGVKYLATGNRDWMNPDASFNKYLNDVTGDLQKVLPIHATEAYDNGNIGQQLMSSKFWTDDAATGAGFLFAQFLGSKGLEGGLNLIGKGAALAAESSGSLAALYKAIPITERIAMATAHNFKVGTIGFLNAASESAMQASDTARQIKQNLKEKYAGQINPDTGDFYTPAETDIMIAKRQGLVDTKTDNTFWATMAVLLVPSIYESKLFLGAAKTQVGELNSDIMKAVNAGTTSLADIEAGLGYEAMKKTGWKSALKEAGKGALAEGLFEEGTENAIQKYDVDQATAGNSSGLWDSKYGYLNQFLDGFTQKDGLKAMILGSILGGAMGGAHAIGETREHNEALKSHLDSMGAADQLYGQSIRTIYQTDPKDPTKLLLDAKGEPVENVEALQKLTFQMLHDKNNWDNQTAAIVSGNQDMATLNEHVALSQSIAREVQSGRYDSIDNAREYFKWFHGQRIKEQAMQEAKATEDQQVADKAKTDTTEPAEGDAAAIKTASAMKTGSAKSDADLSIRVNQSSALVDKMFDHWKTTEKQATRLTTLGESPVRTKFNETVRRTLYYEAAKREALTEILKDKETAMKEVGANRDKLNQETTVISKLIQDSEARSSDYLNNKKGLFESWNELNTSREGLIAQSAEAQKNLSENKEEENRSKLDRKANEAGYKLREHFEKEGRATDPVTGQTFVGDGTDGLGTNQFSINQPIPLRAGTTVGSREEGRFNAGMDYRKMLTLRNIMDKVRTGEAGIEEAVGYANDNLSSIDKDTRTQLQQLVTDQNTSVAQDEQKLATMDEMDPETFEFNPEYGQLSQSINRRKEAVANAQNILAKNNTQSELDKLKGTPEQINDQLNIRFAEKAFTRADNIMDNALEENGKVKDTYTDSRSVNDAMAQITSMRNAIEDRVADGDLKGKTNYNYLIEKANQALAKLQTISNAVEDNKLKRDGIQKSLNQKEAVANTAALGFNLDTNSISNQGVYNHVNGILEGKLGDMIAQVRELESGNHYESTMAILHAVKTKATTEEMSTLTDLLTEQNKDLVNALPALGKSASGSRFLLKEFLRSPAIAFEGLFLAMHSDVAYDETKQGPIFQFRRNNDIDELESALMASPDTQSKEDTLQLVRTYRQLLANNRVSNLLNSSLNLSTTVTGELARAKDSDGIVPTTQQEIAIRDGLAWISSDENPKDAAFSGWAFLRGIAGTGKTNVTVKWLLNLSGLKAEEVTTSAATQAAADVIGRATGTQALTVEAIMAAPINPNTKLIVIDEYARTPADEMMEFEQKVREHNKNLEPKDRVRVLILGDPSQITPSTFSFEDVTNPGTNKKLGNIRVINPLTVVYRSEVSAVNETSDIFQDNPDVVSRINVRADRDSNIPLAVGTHTGKSSQEIIDIIARNKKFETDNGLTPRTRVIISDNPAQFADTGVPVLSVYDAQSETFDEAYVDLSPNSFADSDKFNTAMYTAASRARQYSYIKYQDGVNTLDPGLNREKENNDKTGRDAKGQYIKDRTEELSLMEKAAKGQPMVVTPTEAAQKIAEEETPLEKGSDPEVQEDTEIVTETPSASPSEVLPTDSEPSGPVDPNTEAETNYEPPIESTELQDGENMLPNIEKGTFEALAKKDEQGEDRTPDVVPGSPVKYMYTKEKNGENAITVFAFDAQGNWLPISKIFQEEIDKHPHYANFKAKVAGMKPMFSSDPQQLNGTTTRAALDPADYTQSLVHEATVSRTQRMTYVFGNENAQPATTLAEHIKNIFKSKFFSSKASEQAKADTLHFRIFRNNEIQSGKFGDFIPEAGIPYAIIGAKPGASNLKGAQFVRLTANSLSQNSEHYKTLKAYRDSAKKIEQAIGVTPGTEMFSRIVRAMKPALEIKYDATTSGQEPRVSLRDNYTRAEFQQELEKSQNPTQPFEDPTASMSDDEFNRLLPEMQGLASMIYDLHLTDTLLTESEMEHAHGSDYEHIPVKDNRTKEVQMPDGTTEVQPLGRIRLKGTGGKTGKAEVKIRHYELSSKKGKAQVALNQLAKANEYVGNVRIRIDENATVGRQSTRGPRPTGKSLLADKSGDTGSFQSRKVLGQILGESKVLSGELSKEDLERKDTRIALEKEIREMAGSTELTIPELAQQIIAGSQITPEDANIWMTKLDKILNQKDTLPINMATLDLMVGDENYDANGEHLTAQAYNVRGTKSGKVKETQTYLRTPLDIDQFNALGKDPQANAGELSSMVGTKFQDLLPTQIAVANNVPQQAVSPNNSEPVQPERVVPGSKQGLQDQIDELGKQIAESKGLAKAKLLKAQKELINQRDASTRMFDENSRRGDKGEKITIAQAREEIAKLLPAVTEDQMNFLTRSMMIEMQRPGESLLGLYQKGKMFFLENDGSVYSNVVRHEVFHAVFNDYLSQRDRNNVAKEFDPQGKMTPVELEEALADRFMTWKTSPETVTGKIKRIFNRIANWFGLASSSGRVDQLFNDINNGKFQKPNASTSNTRMAFSDIKKYGNVKGYKEAATFVQGLIRDNFIEPNIENTPLTQAELFNTVARTIQAQQNELNTEIDTRVESNNELYADYQATEDAMEKSELEEYINLNSDQIALDNQKLVMLNTLNDGTNLKDMWTDLYPNFKFAKEGIVSFEENEIQEDPEAAEVDVDQATKAADGSIAADFVQQSDERNQEQKISQNVKNFLSFMYRPDSWTKEGKQFNGRINPRGVYLQCLRNLAGLQSSDTDFVQQLTKRAEENGINMDGHSDGAAIIKHLIDLYNQATGEQYIFTTNEMKDGKAKALPVPLDRTMRFLDDNTFLVSLDGKDISELTDKSGPNLDVFERGSQSTAKFLAQVQASGISMEEAKGYFRQHQAQETLRELMSNFLSQRESTPMIAEEERGMSTVLKYFRAQNHGVERTKLTELEGAFKENFLGKVTPDAWKAFLANKNGEGSAIADLLKTMGVKGVSGLRGKSSGTILKVYGDLKAFKGEVEKEVANPSVKVDKEATDSDETFVAPNPIATVLERSSNSDFVGRLTQALLANSSDQRASSYTDTTGKKRYLFHNGSQAHDILGKVLRFFNNKIGSMPAHLAEDSVLSKNIFTPTGVGFHDRFEILDHDGQRQMGKEEFATGYSGESNSQWLKRNFADAFLTFAKTNASNNADALTYMQNFYTISNRPRMVGARVKILGNGELMTALEKAIEQHVTQPDLSSVKNYDRFKAVNFDEFHTAIEKMFLEGKTVKQLASNTEGRLRLADVYNSINQDPQLKQEVVLNIMEQLNEQAEQAMLRMAAEKVVLSSDTSEAMKLLKDPRRAVIGSEDATLEGGIGRDNTWSDLDAMRPTVRSFYMNNYVNGFFLNQMVVGNMNYFKDGLDVVKRMSGVFAPGTKGMIGNKFFMQKKFNVAISSDPKMYKEMLSPIFKDTKLMEELSAKGFDLADAQGFMLPERAANIVQGFGRAYNAGAVFKPAHYEIAKRTVDGVETYVPVMLKYSSVVLSDDLVSRFPKLQALRTEMRRSGAHEFIFDSGTKVGATSEQVKLPGVADYDDNNITIKPESLIELSAENYRLQLNPAHEAYAKTSNPTQLGYFLNVLHKMADPKAPNLEAADKVYGAIAEKISRGLKALTEKATDSAGRFTTASIQSMLTGAGNERLQEMLGSGLTYNMPNIVDKAVIQMANMVSRDTVKIQFPGGKMVLQSSYGVDLPGGLTEADSKFWTKYGISESDKENSRRLEYKEDPETGRWHAEVLLPMAYKDKANPGDFLLPDAMGFRIPSTELHSSLPLKIAGFYDDKGSNVVIGPAELVAQHGSDFDVDSLYVISREQASKDVETYNFSIAKGAPVGYYTNGTKLEFNGVRFRNELEQAKIDAAGDPKILKALEKLHDQFLNNQITESFLETISHPSNKQRMLTPISTEVITTSLKALGINTSNSVNLSRLLDNLQVFNSNFQGASLVGIFANGMKALSYMSRAGVQTEGQGDAYPQIKQAVEWNGRTYDSFTEIDHTGGNLWEELDALVNTSVDNVKEQKLYHMNATDRTGPVYVAAKAIGMPLTEAMRMMLQPVVKQFANTEGGRATVMVNLKAAMAEKAKELEIISDSQKFSDIADQLKEFGQPDEKALNDAIKRGDLGSTKEEFAHQFRALQQFEAVNKMAEDLTTFSRAIKILQDMPVFYKDIATQVDLWNKLGVVSDGSLKTSEDFSFTIDNLMEVQPNIKAAYEAFQWMKQAVDNSVIKHYPAAQQLASELNAMRVRVELGNDATNIEAIKNEIMSYLVSAYYSNELDTQQPISLPGKNNKGITLTGKSAWSQDFGDRLKKVLKLNEDAEVKNPFLKRLAVATDGWGINSVQFANVSNPDPEEALEMQEGFSALEDEQLKQDFVKYAVLNYGLSFGVKNYSMFIPSELLHPMSDYISKNIKGMMEQSKMDETGTLIAGPMANIKQNLSIRMAVNNIEGLPFISNQRIPAVQTLDAAGKPMYTDDAVPIMSGFDGEYFWHRAFDNPIEGDGEKRKFDENQLPQFIQKNDGNGRKVAYYRLNDPKTNDRVYYQRIGYANFRGGYDANTNVINNGYNPEDYFGKGVIPVPVSDVRTSPYTANNDYIKEGVEVIVYPYSNDTRDQGIKGIVDKVIAPLAGNGPVKFTLKEAPFNADTRTMNPEQIRMMEVAESVTSRFGLSLATDLDLSTKGQVLNGQVTLNPKTMTADTAFHEVSHPLVAAIQAQNPAWYGKLVEEMKSNPDGKKLLAQVKAKYPELDPAGQEVEALVTAIGLEAARRLEKSGFRTMVRRLMRSVGEMLKGVLNQLKVTGGISLQTLANESMVNLTLGDIAEILANTNAKIDLSQVADRPQFSKDLTEEEPAKGSVMSNILAKAEEVGDPTRDEHGQEGDTYTFADQAVTRVSKLMDKFTFRDKTTPMGPDGKPVPTIDAIAMREADRMFKNTPPGNKLVIDGIEQSKEEFTEAKKKIQLQARVKGDIIHAKLQWFMARLAGDVQKVNELNKRIDELSSLADKAVTAYDWVLKPDVFTKLLRNAGVNIGTKDKAQEDKIYSEVKVASPELGAGKIDQLVEKPDGRLRIVDWKTGSRLKDKYSANILKYGVQENRITDNPLDRAKLQVMMYALIVKAENPDAKFDGLVVMHLPNEFEATQPRNALGVEVRDYLRMVEQYYRHEEPKVYQALIAKSPKIFDPHEYNAPINGDFAQDVLNSNGASDAEVLEKYRLDLQKLVLSVEMGESGWGRDEIKLREELIRKIRQTNSYINTDFTGALDAKNEISMMTRWLGNLNDTHNPYVQNFAQELAVNRAKANEELDGKMAKFRQLLKPVIDQRVGKRGIVTNALTWINKEKVYSNLWATDETVADDGTKYLSRGLKTEQHPTWDNLSKEEKALSVYMRKEMKDIFDDVMVKGKQAIVGVDAKGNPMTKLDLYNSKAAGRRGANFKYTDGFVPRVAITAEEVAQRAAQQGISGVGTYVKDKFLRHMTDYFENNIEGQNQKDFGMPVRFLGNGNTYTSPESYTTDLELAFGKYMEQMVNKKHLDTTWMYGQAVKGILEGEKDGTGESAFKNTAAFLDFHMKNILIGDRLQRSGKGITRTGFAVHRGQGNEYNVSTLKAYRSIKGVIAGGTLWLQPVRSAKNAMQATYMNAKEAAVGSIFANMKGVKMNEQDLSLKNHYNSYGEAIASQSALFTGNKQGNFVHALAKKLRLYPDMEIAKGTESMTKGMGLLNRENFGLLYSMPEEITTMQYTLNFLKTMQIQTGKYAGKSMYEMYKNSFDEKTGEFNLPADFVRGKIEKGDGTFEQLGGLHPLEIQKLQRGIQKVKGGYKPDEKTAIQNTILGDAFMMFKRWIPSMLVAQYKSKYTDPSIGQFEPQKIGDELRQRDGEPVYEWRARVVEGRGRVLFNWLMAATNLQKFSGYTWSDMSSEQKKAVIDASISFATWIGALGLTAGLLGDRDEKDSLRMFAADMSRRYMEQWSTPTLAEATLQPPAVVKKSLDIFKAVQTLAVAGYSHALSGDDKDLYTNKGDIKGMNVLMKNIPLVSSYYEFNKFNEETDEGSVWNAISGY